MSKSTKHWHAMNGSSGCLPDNNEVHHSKASAIDSLCSSFDFTPTWGMKSALRGTGIYHFSYPRQAGADYAEVACCYEAECLLDRD